MEKRVMPHIERAISGPQGRKAEDPKRTSHESL